MGASQTVAPIVRSGSVALGETITTGTARAVNGVTNVVSTGRQQAGTAMEEHVTGRIKRIWHLLLTALMLCWAVPMFGLRLYQPMNALMANLGIVWSLWFVCCPPRSIGTHRGKRMGMLIL